MHVRRSIAALGALALATIAGAASAAENNYVLTLPNQSGTIVGTPFTNETVIYTIRADTATLTSYPQIANFPLSGKCVTASSGSVQIGTDLPVALTGSNLFCTADAGTLTGVYFTGANGWNHHLDSGVLDLSTPGSSVGPGPDHNLAIPYAIPITGGTLSITSDNSSGNTATAAVVAVAVPTAIPTLSEWAMIVFGFVLAGSTALFVQRRRSFT